MILVHHRLAHSGTKNFSAQIRQAVFYDFVKQEAYDRFPADAPSGPWLLEGDEPPPADMTLWRDWPGLHSSIPKL